MQPRSSGALLGVLVLLCSPALTGTALAADLHSSAYEETQWASTGMSGGATNVGVVDHDTIELSYNATGRSGVSYRTTEFSVEAATDGTASFDWTYDFHHAWFYVDADLWVWADGPSGRKTVQLVNFFNRHFTGARSLTGTTSITVHEGYDFGIRVGGRNGDSASFIRGTVTLDNFSAPADRDGDGVDDDDDLCPDEETYGYDVDSDGCIADKVGPSCPLARGVRSGAGDFNNMSTLWGALSTGDATVSGRMAGALRVVGDADVSSFDIGQYRLGSYALASQNHVKARSGTFHGDVRTASKDIDGSVSFAGGTVRGTVGLHIDEYMEALSEDLYGQVANGGTVVRPWGEIELTGTHEMLNIFDVKGSDLSAATKLSINVPAGSSALVNVDGGVVSFGPSGSHYVGATASKTVFNFFEATDLTIGSVSIDGQVVAPFANVDVRGGDIEGTLTGAEISGRLTQYNAAYDGRVCADVAPGPTGPTCEVTYGVASSWPGGFSSVVTVTNTGAALSSWDLDWSFTNGETVASAWSASTSQVGADVTASDVGWNGALPTGGSVNFGFNGNGSPVKPAAFELNGVSCTVK